jgi:hypothetical protein
MRWREGCDRQARPVAASTAIALAFVGPYLPALLAGLLWLAVPRRVERRQGQGRARRARRQAAAELWRFTGRGVAAVFQTTSLWPKVLIGALRSTAEAGVYRAHSRLPRNTSHRGPAQARGGDLELTHCRPILRVRQHPRSGRPAARSPLGSVAREARRAARRGSRRHLVGQQARLGRLPGRPRPGGCRLGCFSGLCAKLLAIGQHELCGVGMNRGVNGCDIASADRTQGLTGPPACRSQW